MSCPHRAVRSVKVIPRDAEEQQLAMGVAHAIASATNAGAAICKPDGRAQAWIFCSFCRQCDDELAPDAATVLDALGCGHKVTICKCVARVR